MPVIGAMPVTVSPTVTPAVSPCSCWRAQRRLFTGLLLGSATAPALAAITATVAQAGANVDEVHHQRAFTLLAAQNVEIELVIQTRGPDHVQAVLQALEQRGW